MKTALIALTAALSLCSCAGSKVVQTQVATGALSPQKIFIRPFGAGEFAGNHEGEAMRTIHHSQAGNEFAQILKTELEKLAPTTVLKPGESPDGGWLVAGELEQVNAGSPIKRAFIGQFGQGRSGILVHVQIKDMEASNHHDGKGGTGNTLYEFDVAGGSRGQGHLGTTTASGLGYAPSFDYRNVAERIAQTLDPDREKYGVRSVSSRH